MKLHEFAVRRNVNLAIMTLEMQTRMFACVQCSCVLCIVSVMTSEGLPPYQHSEAYLSSNIPSTWSVVFVTRIEPYLTMCGVDQMLFSILSS